MLLVWGEHLENHCYRTSFVSRGYSYVMSSLWDNAMIFYFRFQKTLLSSNNHAHTHTPATQKMENRANTYSHSISSFFMSQNCGQSTSYNLPKIRKKDWYIVTEVWSSVFTRIQQRKITNQSSNMISLSLWISWYLFSIFCLPWNVLLTLLVLAHVTPDTILLGGYYFYLHLIDREAKT